MDKINKYLKEISDREKKFKIDAVRKRTVLNMDARRELTESLEDFLFPVTDMVTTLLNTGNTIDAAKFQKAVDSATKIVKGVIKKYR